MNAAQLAGATFAKSALTRLSRKLHISKWPLTIPAGNLGLFARKKKTT